MAALIVAYRRYKVAESIAALERVNAQLEQIQVYDEQFTAAAAQIDDEKAAIRLAGVRAMAGLADYWPEHRQACVDVLCGYLRMPHSPNRSQGAPPEDRLKFDSARDVHDTVLRIITSHLRPGAEVSWRGLDFDFTGVALDDGDFSGVGFAGGEVSFGGAEFSGGQVSFNGADFSGGEVSFNGAEFSGGEVSFNGAEFSGGEVSFGFAAFAGGQLSFNDAEFSGGLVDFRSARFSGARISFVLAKFPGGRVSFLLTKFSGGQASFNGAKFSGALVDFSGTRFSGGLVDFFTAEFSGGLVSFDGAQFTSPVSFLLARFSGGQVDFSKVADWSQHPNFDGGGTQPSGVRLPTGSGTSGASEGPTSAGS